VGATVRSAGSGQSPVGTAIDVTKPTCVVGDYLIVAIPVQATTVTLTPPAGWTEFTTSPVDGSTDVRLRAWYRKVDGSEAATLTWTSSLSEKHPWGIVSCADGHQSSPVRSQVESGNATADTTCEFAATGSLTVGDLVIIIGAMDGASVGAWTPPATYIERVDQFQDSSFTSVFMASKEITSAGVETPAAASFTGGTVASASFTFALAIDPSAAGGRGGSLLTTALS